MCEQIQTHLNTSTQNKTQTQVFQGIKPGHRNILEVFGVVLVVYGATQTVLVEIFKSKSKCCHPGQEEE